MAYKVRKFQSPDELESFMNGSVVGDAVLPHDMSAFIGKDITVGAQTVTFEAAAEPDKVTGSMLPLREFLKQLSDGLGADYKSGLRSGRLRIEEATPTNGVKLTGGSALSMLGYPASGTEGSLLDADSIVQAYMGTDGSHTLITK